MTLTYDPRLSLDSIPKGQRIIVCGGRDYDDDGTLRAVLTQLAPREVAQGDARGADRLAWNWCYEHGITCRSFPAYWARDGKAAGPMRNRRMFHEFKPDGVVAFPGGRGTADMCAVGERGGVWVVRVP